MRHLVVVVFALLCAPLFAGTVTDLFISEYVEGSSNEKAIEIYNGTASAVALDGHYRLSYFFNGTSSELTVLLHGTIAPGDVHVIAHSDATFAADEKSGGGWFNGNDAVLLLHDGIVIDAIGQRDVDPAGGEWGAGSTSTMDNTLRRKPAVCSGDTNAFDVFLPSIEWIGFATNTFTGLGTHSTSGCTAAPDAREIHEIQGNGDTSPLAGEVVLTKNNIVTGVGSRGFFLQTPAGRADFDDATSNGIYVFTSTAPAVVAGNVVDVIGTVTEFGPLTELTNATVTVTGTASLPAPVAIAPGVAALEHLEGMLVRIHGGIAASGTKSSGAVRVVAGGARPFREPGLSWDGNPEMLQVYTNALDGVRDEILGGAAIDVAEGPLYHAKFEESSTDVVIYEIWPSSLAFRNPEYPRAVRPRAEDELTIATQNLHDFRVGDSDHIAEAARQIREVLRAPDVLALQEVFTLGALQALADRIRADDAALSYNAYLVEGNDPRGIDIGYLVRDTVQVEGVAQWGADEFWTPPGGTTPVRLYDRPPLVLRARRGGFAFTVIAVHLKSYVGIENDDTRQKRREQALRLSRHLQTLQTAHPGIHLAVVGDFNAPEFSDGIVDVVGQIAGSLDPGGALLPGTDEVNPDLTNQVLRIPASGRYSYVFLGNAQVLDHALTSVALTSHVVEVRFGRANADASSSMPTISDHDSLVVYVRVSESGHKRRAVRR